MRNCLLPLVTLGVLASPAGAQTVTIDHQPVACATVDKFPRLEARFAPSDQMATARVVFQGQTADWYSVTMKAEGGVYAGVLPKPKKDLKSFRYYIDVTDKALGTNRTTEYTASVVDSVGACKGKLMAGALSSASVILQGPAGVVALPAGFASTGVVAGSAAGSGGAAVGTAAAGAGGGIGATALVVGGVAVAGAAVAVGVSKAGGDEGDSGSGSGNESYNVNFLPSPPGIDVSVCAGRPMTWSSQGLGPDKNGNFDTTWAPNEPNTVRISGQVTATNFQATLACTNGARSGSISATGSNGNYTGTFSFGPSTGQVSITKR